LALLKEMVFFIHLFELVNGPGHISFGPGPAPVNVGLPRAGHLAKIPILIELLSFF
jgi:hypothetical protein